jgi:hypothetical protein
MSGTVEGGQAGRQGSNAHMLQVSHFFPHLRASEKRGLPFNDKPQSALKVNEQE